jgi:hypothetical protein
MGASISRILSGLIGGKKEIRILILGLVCAERCDVFAVQR